jgi:hypothetical protein
MICVKFRAGKDVMKKVSSLAVDFREKDDGDEYWNNVCVDGGML